MLLSEAVEHVTRLIDRWPNGRQGMTDGYLGGLAAVLTDYPRAIAIAVCDPRRGIARETRFLPTIADLVTWCDREVAPLRAIVAREDREIALQAEMAQRRIEDRTERETLAQLRARLGPAFGLRRIDEPTPKQQEDDTDAADQG